MTYDLTTATKKILKIKKRIRAVCGGTSASKTISILLYLIDKSQSDSSHTLTSVVSESTPHLKRGAIRDFKNIMQAHGYWNDRRWNATDFIYTFESRSQIEFFSADQSDKLRGARRDRGFINEANNNNIEVFNQLEVRTKEFLFLDWNPTDEFWFYTELLPNRKKDIEFITLTYKDNEALSPEIVESIESRKYNKNWFKVYGLGQLGEIEGRIYTGWKIIDELPHEARLERYGLDFGYSNDPTCIVGIYYYNGGWVFDEKLYHKGMSNKQIADFMNNIEKKGVLTVADSAEPKSIDEIRSYGVNITACKKGKDSVRTGIQLIQDQPISITKSSVNGIKEYRNYLWMTDKNGNYLSPNTPVKFNDHFLDAARYATSTLARLKQEQNYWDNIFQDELDGKQQQLNNSNRGR